MIRMNFVILKVSGQNVNGEYHLNTCIALIFFCLVWPGGNAVFILTIYALHTFLVAFLYTMFYSLYALFSVDAYQE